MPQLPSLRAFGDILKGKNLASVNSREIVHCVCQFKGGFCQWHHLPETPKEASRQCLPTLSQSRHIGLWILFMYFFKATVILFWDYLISQGVYKDQHHQRLAMSVKEFCSERHCSKSGVSRKERSLPTWWLHVLIFLSFFFSISFLSRFWEFWFADLFWEETLVFVSLSFSSLSLNHPPCQHLSVARSLRPQPWSHFTVGSSSGYCSAMILGDDWSHYRTVGG